LTNLLSILQKYQLNITKLDKIEAFDISNISGKYAVSASVVFINGLQEKQLYRKYKIKIDDKPNDVAMMKETLLRRLSHTEWPYPDLILVDGGKPQVKAIYDLLHDKKINLPVIGLAKREEIIVIYVNNQFKQIKIRRNDDALKLLQQIRDEVHRFAISYHRQLRSSALTNVN
jgi:excinuclease ABC subunit C